MVPTGLALLGTDVVYRSMVRLDPRRAATTEASMAAVVRAATATGWYVR